MYISGIAMREATLPVWSLFSIIAFSTSDDVFDRFADWNRKVWPDRVEDYTDYMESIALSIG